MQVWQADQVIHPQALPLTHRPHMTHKQRSISTWDIHFTYNIQSCLSLYIHTHHTFSNDAHIPSIHMYTIHQTSYHIAIEDECVYLGVVEGVVGELDLGEVPVLTPTGHQTTLQRTVHRVLALPCHTSHIRVEHRHRDRGTGGLMMETLLCTLKVRPRKWIK